MKTKFGEATANFPPAYIPGEFSGLLCGT